MVAHSYTNIACDTCDNCSTAVDSLSIREARAEAYSEGWFYIKGANGTFYDICPDCEYQIAEIKKQTG